jgi:hypothetical protein
MEEVLFNELIRSVYQMKEYELLAEARKLIKEQIDIREQCEDDEDFAYEYEYEMSLNDVFAAGLRLANQIIKNIVNENYKVTKIEKPEEPIDPKSKKHWCMCKKISAVAKDFDRTCCQCNGKDSYGVFENRPKELQKVMSD